MEELNTELVEYEVIDGVAFIRLNRPEKLNAITDEMALVFRERLLQLDEDDEAQVGIICGNGRSFCAGFDIRQRLLRPVEEIQKLGSLHARGSSISEHFYGFARWKPILAALHGHVIGAGLTLALRCDLMVTTDTAKFQIAETARGLDVTGFWSLLTFLGAGSFASDVTLTGRFWSGQEAFDHGIANRVTDEGGHLEVAEALAREIMALPPLSIRATVRNRRLALQELQVQAARHVTQGLNLSADFRESAQAFVEKRDPNFKGS